MLPNDVARCPGLLTAADLRLVAPCVDCRRRVEPAGGDRVVNMAPVAYRTPSGWRCASKLEPLIAEQRQVA